MKNSLVILSLLIILISFAQNSHGVHITKYSCTRSLELIPKKYFCDGEVDCLDHSDETTCCLRPEAYDDEEYFLCEDGEKCIPKSWLKDGEMDCKDGSDELLRVQPKKETENSITGPIDEFETSVSTFRHQWLSAQSTITHFVRSMEERKFENLTEILDFLEIKPCYDCSEDDECEYLKYNSSEVTKVNESYHLGKQKILDPIRTWTNQMSYNLTNLESQVGILKKFAIMKQLFCSMKSANESCLTRATEYINSEVNRYKDVLSTEEQQLSKGLFTLQNVSEKIKDYEINISGYALQSKSQYLCCKFQNKPYFNQFCSFNTSLAERITTVSDIFKIEFQEPY